MNDSSAGQQQCAGSFWGADTGPNPSDRGKTGGKHHLLVETRHGLPLACHVPAANVPDVKAALATVDAMPIIGGKRGGPERKPGVVIADQAYDADWLRVALEVRGTRNQ